MPNSTRKRRSALKTPKRKPPEIAGERLAGDTSAEDEQALHSSGDLAISNASELKHDPVAWCVLGAIGLHFGLKVRVRAGDMLFVGKLLGGFVLWGLLKPRSEDNGGAGPE